MLLFPGVVVAVAVKLPVEVGLSVAHVGAAFVAPAIDDLDTPLHVITNAAVLAGSDAVEADEVAEAVAAASFDVRNLLHSILAPLTVVDDVVVPDVLVEVAVSTFQSQVLIDAKLAAVDIDAKHDEKVNKSR